MIENNLTRLPNGSMKYDGIMSKLVDFINKEQLLNSKLWQRFVQVYRGKEDGDHQFLNWKGEFWGKMMRGASLCYKYENNDELYKVLENTVLDMLSTQDEFGRFSSYPIEKELFSWDVWGRKYVLTSMEHFYSICKSEDLKKRIVTALEKHVNYIMDHVGPEEGKKQMNETSDWWLGVNSCSILEPIVGLYRINGKQKYLDYAKYIVDLGGIRDGNLIECAKEGKLLPYQYPEAKAYETMSYFEGVLDYALVTNNEELKGICIKFYEDVYNSDISITGNAGANEENFNNAHIEQTVKPEKFAQETCVTVTWMRILSKLFLLTGDPKYFDRFSTSSYNAYYGSVNFYHQSARDWWTEKLLQPLPFDSYSPLVCDRRGMSTGGLQYMIDGSIYGCCACIGSAGIGLMGIDSVLKDDKYIYINEFFNGDVNLEEGKISLTGNYISTGEVNIILQGKVPNLAIRIPSWANESVIKANGIVIEGKPNEFAYINVDETVKEISIKFNPKVVKSEINNMIAYTYGQIVLAITEEDNPNIVLEDIKDSDILNIKQIEALPETLLRFEADYKGKKLYFRDYSSSGKKWDSPNNKLTVWIKK